MTESLQNDPAGADKPKDTTTEAYTLRLDKAVAKKFDRLRGDQSIRHAGQEAIEAWIKGKEDPASRGVEPATAVELRESLQEILVSAVTEHLRSQAEWADKVITAGSLMDLNVSVYLRRVHHFYGEKKVLSENFVPWLVKRMFHLVAHRRNVCLVVESGTTLTTTMDYLAPEFAKHPDLQGLEPQQMFVVTNNFPGAECYESAASKIQVGNQFLSDVLPCDLVPGKALREYSAVVGTQAEDYLRNRCKPPKGKRDLVRIGLVVGNWVMLEDSPARPIPLARGKGHKSFKDVLLDSCDEVYLITPLCKMIQAHREDAEQSLAEFNKDYQEISNEKGDKYERVARAQKVSLERRLKLVATVRTNRRSIVLPHTIKIQTALGSVSKPNYDDDVTKRIEEVPNFLYRYDAHSRMSFDNQLRVELPHKTTQEAYFRKKYFLIEDEDLQLQP